MNEQEKTGSLRRAKDSGPHDEKYLVVLEDKEVIFLCDILPNKTGFKHVVQVFVYDKDGKELSRGKHAIQYYNRTWEYWKYQEACINAVERLHYLTLKDEAIVKTILMEETP